MKGGFVISTDANHNDIFLTVIKDNPHGEHIIISFHVWSNPSHLDITVETCNRRPSRTSLQADGRTKCSVQGVAIFFTSPDPAFVGGCSAQTIFQGALLN